MPSTLTRDDLINARWSWGEAGVGPITTSFYFGADGQIKVYAHPHERSWSLQDGRLHIYNDAGALAWVFETAPDTDGRRVLRGRQQWAPDWDVTFQLEEHRATAPTATEAMEAAPEEGGGSGRDEIRLVIWDLDDTFWKGTLSEEGIVPIERNMAIVRALNDRGIVSAICSKNDFATTRAKLEELGIWDEFVFPEISWSPKGAMIKSIVRNAQLRPETILFIDDNPLNINEAKFYVPKLRTAEPDIIPTLLDDPRLAGKHDPARARLARYRILQTKLAEQAAFAGDNETFLRDSRIRVSFHADVEAEFARVHDLVNRTNQLNFTKNRWPEDAAAAREQFHAEESADFFGSSGYVKVSDRYGSYGICGYYAVASKTCTHFLFSCRTMNMGVEQFVWDRLGRPFVPLRGEVISDIDRKVDWIAVVEDADAATGDEAAWDGPKPTVCIRGACDMSMTSNYLRTRVDTLEELTFAYQGWEICSLPRIVAAHDELGRAENQALIARLPGMPPGRFDSDLMHGIADAYVLSFSQESFHGSYRARSTGLVVPMGHFSLGWHQREKMDYTQLSYAELLARGVKGVSAEQWESFTSEFEFVGGFDPDRFVADVRKLFTMLRERRKTIIVIGLNSQVGRDRYILAFFARINALVLPIVREFGVDYIDVNQFVRQESDLAQDGALGGPHFAREVYRKLADAILPLLPAARRTAEAA